MEALRAVSVGATDADAIGEAVVTSAPELPGVVEPAGA